MSISTVYDYIVVGSGPSGAIASKTLVDSNAKVLMLDVGNIDNKYQKLIPDKDFETIRKTIEDQHRFFIGDNLESIPQTETKVGAQLSPSRRFIIKGVEKYIPLISDNFTPMESLAYGGLGAGWGLGTYVYSKEECEKTGLDYQEMMKSYQYVADHIGISADNDDVKPFILNNLSGIQKPLEKDNSAKKILSKYQNKRKYFNKRGMFLGSSAMAILTEDKDDRKACSYKDMDFYTDKEKSAYRPQFTIDKLRQTTNFEYKNNLLALKFIENDGIVNIECFDLRTKENIAFKTKKLVLATGALGTARIVLRSLPSLKRLPLLSNPYAYIPGIHWSMLGKKLDSKKNSMAQLMMIYDTDGSNSDLVSLAFYTYQSLMLYRLVKESPLNIADNRIIFQYLQSAFLISGVHHPDSFSKSKYLELNPELNSVSGDNLVAHYELNANEIEIIRKREKTILKALIKLGITPIKRINPGAGSSIHYGGTLPFNEINTIGNQSYNGQVYGAENVYIADSSGFKYLPAKGVTLSIMANAHRVCNNLINNG
jgi:hypothetical protein